ncbi:MAG: hypothetical protein WCL39_10970, partial [Armatimonadota bacterium]
MRMKLFLTLIFLLAGSVFSSSVMSTPPPYKPLEYRIASFHRGRANKELIKRAHQLGYNGVQFQLEGSVMGGLRGFAERDRKEGYVKLCHSLGMKVTLWIHELSDIPGEKDPGYPGPITLENEKLWKSIEDRYELVLGEIVPDIDGLVLTVVETQINAANTDLMLKLVDIIHAKCLKYHKELHVRTFTWHPEELTQVVAAVKRMPPDVVVMSKIVPQDWQMRGTMA